MDRITKTLLALIAVALWGLLLRPFLSLPLAQAAPPPAVSILGAAVPGITDIPNSNYVLVVQNGMVYKVQHNVGTSSGMLIVARIKLQ